MAFQMDEGLTNITWEAIGGSVIAMKVEVTQVKKLPYADFNYTFSSNCDVMNLQADASEDFPDAV